jgi:membrane protease YdiL (CAAX protease family)
MKNLFRFKGLKFSWQLGLALILLLGVPRFLLVLEANRTANYNFTSVIFVVMALLPFLLLRKAGRRLIGIRRVSSIRSGIYAFLLGMGACSIVFLLGRFLYQDGIENWFEYISRSYGAIPETALQGSDRFIYFLIFALMGMTFSPVGEELLYRGLIHQSFVPRFGENKASIIDSLAFATVHLAHFGLVYDGGKWKLLLMPALIWMGLMFWASRLFYYCKTRTDSIYGSIFCHAGFNLAMTYFIFYWIL